MGFTWVEPGAIAVNIIIIIFGIVWIYKRVRNQQADVSGIDLAEWVGGAEPGAIDLGGFQ